MTPLPTDAAPPKRFSGISWYELPDWADEMADLPPPARVDVRRPQVSAEPSMARIFHWLHQHLGLRASPPR